jgi:hypothetical protein
MRNALIAQRKQMRHNLAVAADNIWLLMLTSPPLVHS